MNIIKSAISALKLAKDYKPSVKFANELDDVGMSVMEKIGEPLAQMSKKYNIPLTIAQKNNLLLINSGVKTTAVDMRKPNLTGDMISSVYAKASKYLK